MNVLQLWRFYNYIYIYNVISNQLTIHIIRLGCINGSYKYQKKITIKYASLKSSKNIKFLNVINKTFMSNQSQYLIEHNVSKSY